MSVMKYDRLSMQQREAQAAEEEQARKDSEVWEFTAAVMGDDGPEIDPAAVFGTRREAEHHQQELAERGIRTDVLKRCIRDCFGPRDDCWR